MSSRWEWQTKQTCVILTWRGTETWSPKLVIIEARVLVTSMPLHAGFVTDYGYDFGCTPGAEFLIAWGCALAPALHPNELNKKTPKLDTNWITEQVFYTIAHANHSL